MEVEERLRHFLGLDWGEGGGGGGSVRLRGVG